MQFLRSVVSATGKYVPKNTLSLQAVRLGQEVDTLRHDRRNTRLKQNNRLNSETDNDGRLISETIKDGRLNSETNKDGLLNL